MNTTDEPTLYDYWLELQRAREAYDRKLAKARNEQLYPSGDIVGPTLGGHGMITCKMQRMMAHAKSVDPDYYAPDYVWYMGTRALNDLKTSIEPWYVNALFDHDSYCGSQIILVKPEYHLNYARAGTTPKGKRK